MTMFNGAKHDVEDILASIRTSIADRSPGYEMDRRDAHVTALRQRSIVAEEAMEFELPAIFKTSAQPVAERPNLLGRLSEVLSSNGQHDWDRPRTVIPFGPAHGRMIEPPPPVARDTASDAQSRTAARTGADSGAVKRIMPTFFDTRLNRMGGMSYLPAEEHVTIEPPARSPAPVRPPVAARPPVADPPQLPRLPEVASDGFNNGGVEDAAAQLLRPILKQWLTENMPKIVEKALRSESDDDLGGSSRY
jgi:cell pole-organizing protein PopZ